MIKHGKKYKKALEFAVDKPLSSKQALENVKKSAYANFDESVDVSVLLGIDASKGDQVVRNSVLLPHGRGRKIKVVVFAKGDYAEQATKAGADFVGADDLVEKIEGGWKDFTFAIATPDLMGVVGKLAKQLRELLPNKKMGTVTFDVKHTVEEFKKGRAFFRNDKGGAVHFSIGKKSFSVEQLDDNLHAFIKALVAAKPATSKGKFLKSVTVTSTMGIGQQVDTDGLSRS